MVCTDDHDFAEMLRIVRANGWDRNIHPERQKHWRGKHNINSEFEANYTFFDLGYNLRPTEITGFLGLYQLQFLDENIKTRVENFLKAEEIMKKNSDLLILDRSHIDVMSSFVIPVVCKTPELRDKYVKKFEEAGIEVRPMIAGNMQKQPFYKKYVEESKSLKGAVALAKYYVKEKNCAEALIYLNLAFTFSSDTAFYLELIDADAILTECNALMNL